MEYKNTKTPEELMQYMDENIKYGFVSNEGKIYDANSEEWQRDWETKCIVQDGDGLIKTGYGTCWDQVELERKWFQEHNYDFKTYYTEFNCQGIQTSSHTFLIYEKNNKYYWFEHAFQPVRGIHESNSEDELINNVHKNMAMYENFTDEQRKEFVNDMTTVEYQAPKENCSVQEFRYNLPINSKEAFK